MRDCDVRALPSPHTNRHLRERPEQKHPIREDLGDDSLLAAGHKTLELLRCEHQHITVNAQPSTDRIFQLRPTLPIRGRKTARSTSLSAVASLLPPSQRCPSAQQHGEHNPARTWDQAPERSLKSHMTTLAAT